MRSTCHPSNRPLAITCEFIVLLIQHEIIHYNFRYAETRMHFERLYETTQIKGDGEAHPSLSPTDEFADFGSMLLHAIKCHERGEGCHPDFSSHLLLLVHSATPSSPWRRNAGGIGERNAKWSRDKRLLRQCHVL